MGYTREHLLSILQELKIDFLQYEHPIVLTVEAQAEHVGHLKGALSKNLFLKDKKQRFYIVSALANTKVDLKVLSQRLGLGKGGIRMAPEESLAEILQVPLGCVTPLALVNESARNVSLLLDQGFKTQECVFFHPLSNDMTISLTSSDLDKFLNFIGTLPAYIDLEVNPIVGKDQPPDLAALVPSDVTVLADPPAKNLTSQRPERIHPSGNNQATAITAKAEKSSNASQKKSLGTGISSISFADPDKFVEEIMERTSSIVLSQMKEENIQKNGEEELASRISSIMRKQLVVELKNLATIFKNTAYTEGYCAGIHHQPKRL